MGEIVLKGLRGLAFFVFVFPVGVLWVITLIGITLMTARELWLGRRRKCQRRKYKP